MHVALALDMTKLRTHQRKPVFSPSLLLLTLFEIGKKLHSSAKNLQSDLYQLKIIIIIIK